MQAKNTHAMNHSFVYPFDSRELGIYKVSNLSMNVKYFQMEESVQKYIRLPYHDDFVVVPLVHSNESVSQ